METAPTRILLVAPLAESDAIRSLLERESYTVDVANDLDRAQALLRAADFEAVIVGAEDSERALDVLSRARRTSSGMAVVLVGASAECGARAIARGAAGLIALPVDPVEVRLVIASTRERRRLERERIAMLEDARRTRRFFEDVLRGLGEGILVVDHEGKIRYRNPEAARIIGEEDEEETETNQDPEADVPSSGAIRLRQRLLAPLLQLMVESFTDGSSKARMIVLEEEDRKVFLDATTSPLREGDGRVTSTVAIVRDRSAEKLLEEQLVHTERLATLGSLLASIAHEIANPLGVITGAAEIGFEAASEADAAAKRVKDPEAQAALARAAADMREVLEQVREAGVRCHTIAGNLLAYSRRVPAQMKEQDLNELVNRTLSFVGKYLGTDKVEVILKLDAQLPKVRVDAAQIQQAFTNLVDNAVHAMLEQQKTAPMPRRPRLTITSAIADGHALVRIQDEGPGMSEGRLKHLWRPFYTTKVRGTGLGLYITRKVVEHQGGTIAVESAVGKGTTFTIRLPL